jgi:hypothetical protein
MLPGVAKFYLPVAGIGIAVFATITWWALLLWLVVQVF